MNENQLPLKLHTVQDTYRMTYVKVATAQGNALDENSPFLHFLAFLLVPLVLFLVVLRLHLDLGLF